MDNRYFWIKDRVNSEGVQIKYCPTAKMLADFFMKPLQGSLFRTFRDIILGYKHISELEIGDDTKAETTVAQERVGKGNVIKNVNGANDTTSDKGEKKGVSWADVVKGNTQCYQ